MSGNLLQCMGGGCVVRAGCAHYTAPPLPGFEPAERLCARGHDQPEPVARDFESRFAAWIASATPEQVERIKAQLKARA